MEDRFNDLNILNIDTFTWSTKIFTKNQVIINNK